MTRYDFELLGQQIPGGLEANPLHYSASWMVAVLVIPALGILSPLWIRGFELNTASSVIMCQVWGERREPLP